MNGQDFQKKLKELGITQIKKRAEQLLTPIVKRFGKDTAFFHTSLNLREQIHRRPGPFQASTKKAAINVAILYSRSCNSLCRWRLCDFLQSPSNNHAPKPNKKGGVSTPLNTTMSFAIYESSESSPQR